MVYRLSAFMEAALYFGAQLSVLGKEHTAEKPLAGRFQLTKHFFRVGAPWFRPHRMPPQKLACVVDPATRAFRSCGLLPGCHRPVDPAPHPCPVGPGLPTKNSSGGSGGGPPGPRRSKNFIGPPRPSFLPVLWSLFLPARLSLSLLARRTEGPLLTRSVDLFLLLCWGGSGRHCRCRPRRTLSPDLVLRR